VRGKGGAMYGIAVVRYADKVPENGKGAKEMNTSGSVNSS